MRLATGGWVRRLHQHVNVAVSAVSSTQPRTAKCASPLDLGRHLLLVELAHLRLGIAESLNILVFAAILP